MKVLISCAEGYCLSETGKIIYSPGYTRQDLKQTEHEVLCEIAKLAEIRLTQEGISIVSRKYDSPKHAEYIFDKSRHANGCDAAIMIALNSSQNHNAQFSMAFIHMIQGVNSCNLFESTMHSLQRHMPISCRYPNQMRRTPFLETCKRKQIPAVVVLPFFYTEKKLDDSSMGQYIVNAAKAVCEAVLSFHPVMTQAEPDVQ